MAGNYRRQQFNMNQRRMPEVVPVAPIHANPECGCNEQSSKQFQPQQCGCGDSDNTAAGLSRRGTRAKENDSLVDRLLSFVSPFFTKIFGREPELEDIIILGLIIMLVYDMIKASRESSKEDGGAAKNRETESGGLLGGLSGLIPKNLNDNDILLLALFYIFF